MDNELISLISVFLSVFVVVALMLDLKTRTKRTALVLFIITYSYLVYLSHGVFGVLLLITVLSLLPLAVAIMMYPIKKVMLSIFKKKHGDPGIKVRLDIAKTYRSLIN